MSLDLARGLLYTYLCAAALWGRGETHTAKEVFVVGKRSWPDNSHYRDTNKEGSKSYLYETNGWQSHLVEVAEHHPDGTTKAYEADNSILGTLLHGSKGKEK